eukprot:240816-Prorocentrum_minimum.AAC.1
MDVSCLSRYSSIPDVTANYERQCASVSIHSNDAFASSLSYTIRRGYGGIYSAVYHRVGANRGTIDFYCQGERRRFGVGTVNPLIIYSFKVLASRSVEFLDCSSRSQDNPTDATHDRPFRSPLVTMMSRTWKFLKRKFLDYKLKKWGTMVSVLLLVIVPALIALSQNEEPHGFKNPSRGKALDSLVNDIRFESGNKTPQVGKSGNLEDSHKKHDKDQGSKNHNSKKEGSKDREESKFIPPVTDAVRSDHENEESTGESTHLTYEGCGPYTSKRNHGVVVLLMLEGPPFNMLETFARALPSWDKFFLPTQGLDVLLVFPENAAKDIESVAEKTLHLNPHSENDDVSKKLGSIKVGLGVAVKPLFSPYAVPILPTEVQFSRQCSPSCLRTPRVCVKPS